MAKNSMNSIVTFGLIGVAGYFAYEMFFKGSSLPAGVPSSGVSNGFQGVGGGTAAAPKVNDVWIDANANVVAIFNGSAWLSALNASGAAQSTLAQYVANVNASATGAPSSTTTPPTNTATLTAGQVFSQLQSVATAANPNSIVSGVLMLTPDQYNYYLAQVYTPTSSQSSPYGWPPDVLQVWPGIDRTQLMSLANYWSGMSQYLSTKLGLSGFKVFAGLGEILGYFPTASVRAGKLWLN